MTRWAKAQKNFWSGSSSGWIRSCATACPRSAARGRAGSPRRSRGRACKPRIWPGARVVVQMADEGGVLGGHYVGVRREARQDGRDLGQHRAGRQETQVPHHAGLAAVARPVDQSRMAQFALQRREAPGRDVAGLSVSAEPGPGRSSRLAAKSSGAPSQMQIDGDIQDVGEQVRRPAVAAGRQTAGHQPGADGKRHRRLRPEGAQLGHQVGHAAGVVRTNACNGTSIVATPRSVRAWR